MTTHRAIVEALFRSADNDESVVLATVVRISGSSYGGVGTRMVAKVDGTTVGIVSGGCLESDLAEHARDVHRKRVPRVVTYDTRADDDTAWGLGLGCNGLIDVLLEPLPPVQAATVGRLLDHALSARSPSVLATVIGGEGEAAPSTGAHVLFCDETVETAGAWGDNAVLGEIRRYVSDALSAGRQGLVRTVGDAEIAFEIVKPAVHLVVCGTGPDVLPLMRLGTELGWDLTVIDHRPLVPAFSARFPTARVVECTDPSTVDAAVRMTPATAAVVMSHHYGRDLEYVRALIASDAGYIGVLGPRARSERMLAAMTEDERRSAEGRMFAPVGLDIGGDGPEAIALSVLGEISAVIEGRGAGHLRDRNAPLH